MNADGITLDAAERDYPMHPRVRKLIAQARAALSLREALAACERERDEARRDATFGTPLIVESYKNELALREAEIARVRGALADLMAEVCGGSKSCACVGACIHSTDNARAALSTPAPDAALREFERQTIERCAAMCASYDCDVCADGIRALGGAA